MNRDELVRQATALWARWTEMRGVGLEDWMPKVWIEAQGAVDPREPWEARAGLRSDAVRPARHMAVVSLMGTTPSGTSYGLEEVPPRRELCRWEVEYTLLPEFLDVMIELWSQESLLDAARAHAPGWETSVQVWVWQRFCERGRGR